MSNAHLFAVFIADLPSASQRALLKINNTDAWHRLIRVLRLQASESVILFNQHHCYVVQLDEACVKTSGTISGVIISSSPIYRPSNGLTLCVGLTKKEAFESIVYSAAQLGVSRIVPLLTDRIHKPWLRDQDFDRLTKIAIAAAEQSKSCMLPHLEKPYLLSELPEDYLQGVCLGCDVEGVSAQAVFLSPATMAATAMTLFIGPEAGFTQSEIQFLVHKNVQFFRLSPTILRSQEAVLVALGIVRSLLPT